MLDQDRKFPRHVLICSACATTHHLSLFPLEARRSSPVKRKCRGSEGKLWICPHNVLDYDQAKAVEGYFKRPPSGSSRAEVLPFTQNCEDQDHHVYLTQWYFEQSRPIVYFNDEMPLSKKILVAALNSLGVRICPHLRITDETIHSLFSFDFRNLFEILSTRSYARDARPPRYVECVSCHTSISFEIRHSSWPKNGSVLCLEIRKNFGFLKGVTDPRWISHLTSEADLGPLRREWSTWNAMTLRRTSHELFVTPLLKVIENAEKALQAYENTGQNSSTENEWKIAVPTTKKPTSDAVTQRTDAIIARNRAILAKSNHDESQIDDGSVQYQRGSPSQT